MDPQRELMKRREFLGHTLAVLGAYALTPDFAAAAPAAGAATPQAFDYAWLKGRARYLASQAFTPIDKSVPPELEKLDYDDYQAIHPRNDRALWSNLKSPFQLQFFHRGYRFLEHIQINEVVNGQQTRLAYKPDYFEFGKSKLHPDKLPADLGYAGLRIRHKTDWKADITAFLGASYFRAVSGTGQYGLSARGLAIDSGMDKPEEFPLFTEFWVERPKAGDSRLTMYALLDSPSITGAYRFALTPGDTLVMDIDTALYPRKAIQRLGIAPLTSMYLIGENDRRAVQDWRPEIHDSDGLSMQRGNGEWIWRPLVNSGGVRVNSFFDENPRGFGLLQRDTNFDHYQDDGVFYDRRPSAWVEPKAGWGKGVVQLVELGAPDETYDNIVAYWNPEKAPAPGEELLFGYKLHWGGKLPHNPALARTVATRTGLGGVIGQPRKYYSWRFAIDFTGDTFKGLTFKDDVKAMIQASRGTVEIVSARPLPGGKSYRAMFDIKPTDASSEPIDLRLYLSYKDKPLTETWLYQWTPPPPAERKF